MNNGQVGILFCDIINWFEHKQLAPLEPVFMSNFSCANDLKQSSARLKTCKLIQVMFALLICCNKFGTNC